MHHLFRDGPLGSDLLKREMREISPVLGMLDRNAADVSAGIYINLRVRIKILGLDDDAGSELDVEGIRVAKVLDLHGANERSTKALCFFSMIWYSLNSAGAMERSSRRYPSSSSSLARIRSRSITRDLLEVRAVDVPEALKGARGADRQGVERLLVADEQDHAFVEDPAPDP